MLGGTWLLRRGKGGPRAHPGVNAAVLGFFLSDVDSLDLWPGVFDLDLLRGIGFFAPDSRSIAPRGTGELEPGKAGAVPPPMMFEAVGAVPIRLCLFIVLSEVRRRAFKMSKPAHGARRRGFMDVWCWLCGLPQTGLLRESAA